jgi:glutamine synthetase
MSIDIAQRVADENIGLVRFLYADNGGIVRGKAAAANRIGERIESGIGHTVAMMAMSMMDELAPVPGMGPVGEVRITPDASTFTPLPYAPGGAAMLADLIEPDGTPWAACPRTFLKEAIAALAAEGYEMEAAFEPEFTLGTRDAAGFIPLDDSLCYSATGFHLAHDYSIDLVDAAISQGLDVEHYYPELGHGQQEISIHHADPLRAADNHVLLRETARGVALRHGLWASFAPKPLPDQAGNGSHLHASLWRDGANAFADPADRFGLSAAGYHFIAGVRAHLPALVALTCGSVNSYQRLAPSTWAGAWNAYGPDNREAAVRVCSPLGASGSVNLELKPSDSPGNPYLALGAFIHAGLDGLRSKLDPGEPVSVDPASLPAGELGITRLPASLGEALDALEADEFLTSALGPLRSASYLAVKRGEVTHFAGHDTVYELYHHFTKF